MTELSTRIWLDEKLWEAVRRQAIAEGITVRELIPRLVKNAVAPATVPPAQREPAPKRALPSTPPDLLDQGPPVVMLSDIYRCAVCGAQLKLGGLTLHMGKHMKERQESDTERS